MKTILFSADLLAPSTFHLNRIGWREVVDGKAGLRASGASPIRANTAHRQVFGKHVSQGGCKLWFDKHDVGLNQGGSDGHVTAFRVSMGFIFFRARVAAWLATHHILSRDLCR